MKSEKQSPLAASQKTRILIVEDHPIMLQGLTQMINQEKDLCVCGSAFDAHEALKRVTSLKPDLAIVDLSLKGMNGIELIKMLSDAKKKMPVLVLSMHDESLYAERVLRAGGRGYIMKQEAIEKVLVAIRRVLSGEIYLSETMSAKLLEEFMGGASPKETSSVERLSNRELEVFQLIGKGKGTRQIAKELHLSVKTVEAHRENIKKKLHVLSAVELVRHAVQWMESHF